MPHLLSVVSVALLLGAGLTGCAGRGSSQDEAVGDAATSFFGALSSSPDSACQLLAPATLESISSDGEQCPDAVARARPGSELTSGPKPVVQTYGREAIVHWGAETLFLSRFDKGWLVSAAGCESRGEDLPYDCSIEGR
jgi:hypothetical protein